MPLIDRVQKSMLVGPAFTQGPKGSRGSSGSLGSKTPALILAEAAAGLVAAEPEAGTVWRPDGLCRQEADRKSLPSLSSPQWKQAVVRSGEGAGTAPEGAALSPAGADPGIGSYSLAGGPPGQTPGALSPSAAPRSQPPALPFPPPVCPSPTAVCL